MKFHNHQHLRKAAEFQALFDDPDYRISNKAFLVLAKQNNLSYSRLGLVISKKKARHAVDRNYIKRICRETFRLKQDQLCNVDMLILLRSFAKQDDNAFYFSQLGQCFERLTAEMKNSSPA